MSSQVPDNAMLDLHGGSKNDVQKDENSGCGEQERLSGPEQRLISALDDSLHANEENGISSDILARLQQQRQELVMGATKTPEKSSFVSWLKRLFQKQTGQKQTGQSPHSYLGMASFAAFSMVVFSVVIVAVLTPTSTSIPIQSGGTSLDTRVSQTLVSSQAPLVNENASGEEWPMEDLLLVASMEQQDWDLVENAEFIAWLEEIEWEDGRAG